jgi:predicted DNA-binding protein (UPF0251 family)
MRIRLTDHTVRTKREHHGEMRLIPHAPLRTMQECADAMGINEEQAYYIHANAIQKIAAALSAWGYHKEFAQGR